MIRLRQVAFAARDLAAAETDLTDALDVGVCFRDPGVAAFGLHNGLFRVGDQFLEIVSPTEPDTTAGRLLDRRGGDCGYMAIFQVDDLDPVRRRLDDRGVRTVFVAEGDGVVGLHLHPKDVPGAIVSIDATEVAADWPWAGPDWRDVAPSARADAISGVTVAVDDPATTAAIWADVLGVEASDTSFSVDDATVDFVAVGDDARAGIVGLDLTASGAADDQRRSTRLLGVDVRVT